MGLTFLNSTFLFAALAALLPLIIHMLSRRQVKTVDFSSLLFLKELERRKIRRVRIRQILLLVVRSLIILCAALALARPTLQGLGSGASSHARTSVAIVLDTSGSMARRSDDEGLFDVARRRVHQIAELLGDGDEAFLVTASEPPDDLVPGGTFSIDVLRRALDEASPGQAATDYRTSIERSLALLAESRNLNRELYVVGDMQWTGWARGTIAPASGEVPPRILLLPVGGALGNRSVGAVVVEPKYAGTPGSIAITTTVTNHGGVATEVPVRLVIDGVQVGQSGVSLEPGASGDAVFSTVVDRTSWHEGRIELPPDALDSDNVRYFATPPERRTDVLVVSAPGASDERDAYYAKRALDPTGARDPYACAEIPSTSLGHQEQGRFAVVVLADVGRMDSIAERWLFEHMARGGGVVAILGKRTDVRYWNDVLPGEFGAGVIIEPVERRSGMRIAPAGVGHPLLAGLVFGERLIDDASAIRAFRAEPGSGEVVLELPGIGPLLSLTRPERGGRAAVLYTGLDATWSDLPTSGLLVPILHRTVRSLTGDRRVSMDTVVGDDVMLPFDASRSDAPMVERPDGTIVAAERLPGTAGGAVLRSATQTGVYRLYAGGGEDASGLGDAAALAAVNVPATESDLTPATTEEIGAALGGHEWMMLDAGTPLTDAVLVARHGRELWRVFVYAALVLVALEMWIARPRF